MAAIVELKKVDKVYRGAVDTQALSNIDLVFDQGSFNSIVGESGSGKSTLLNIIGILDRPSSGELWLEGQPTSSLNANSLAGLRNRSIGFVFQFHYLLPEFSALENVLMPYLIGHSNTDDSVKKRAEELFDLMGIAGVKDNLANNMSGGQQQRTAIARALMNNPRVLLADEPTGNLDSDNTAVVYRIFREVNRRSGTTFIIVTHDRRIAEQTDRIIEIKDGRIVTDLLR